MDEDSYQRAEWLVALPRERMVEAFRALTPSEREECIHTISEIARQRLASLEERRELLQEEIGRLAAED